jgi:alpha-tubulin suppressor-like RCC1 family protein
MRAYAWKHLLIAAPLLALSGCDLDPSGGGEPRLARVVVVSGALQTGTVGTELPEPVVVRVEDGRGQPMAGQALEFVVAAGDGLLLQQDARTDAEGLARARWMLGPVAGDTQRVEVRATDPKTGQARAFASFPALGRAGEPVSVEVVGGDNQVAVVGSALADSFAVRLRDGQGNQVTGASVAWSTLNGGSLLPNPSTTDAQGVARARWTLPTTAGPLSATATAASASATLAATGVPGPAASLKVTPSSVQGVVGAQVSVDASVVDQFENPVQAAVDFTVADPDVAEITQTIDDRTVVLQVRAVGETTLTARMRGTTTQVVVPLRVPGVPFYQVFAGAESSCGTVDGGATYCWDGTPRGSGFPPPTPGIDVDVIRCGLSLPVRFILNTVRCSGDFAQPWAGTHTAITVGGTNVCAWTGYVLARCWGSDNRLGQLGNGSRVPSPNAVSVSADGWYRQVAAGPDHVCAMAADFTAQCWGGNAAGQLGTGSAAGPDSCDGTPCSTVPVAVTGGLTFSTLTVGSGHSCGLDTGGAAWCWGANDDGQLGDGTTVQRNAPVRVAGGLTFASLRAGYRHTCGITTGGAAYCWGDNASGQLGTGSVGGTRPVPTTVVGGHAFTFIDGGRDHTCAVDTDKRAYCWGSNSHGQLGIGPPGPSRATPQRVPI